MPKNPFRKEPEPQGRFDKFTLGARRVLQAAQEEAQLLGHSFIGTEHFLLGLLREPEGLAAYVLDEAGIKLLEVRAKVISFVGLGEVADCSLPVTFLVLQSMLQPWYPV